MILASAGRRAAARLVDFTEGVDFPTVEAVATEEAAMAADGQPKAQDFMNLKILRFFPLPALAFWLLYMTWPGLVRGGGQPAMSQRAFASPGETTR